MIRTIVPKSNEKDQGHKNIERELYEIRAVQALKNDFASLPVEAGLENEFKFNLVRVYQNKPDGCKKWIADFQTYTHANKFVDCLRQESEVDLTFEINIKNIIQEECLFDEMLNETYEPMRINNTTFMPAFVLYELDKPEYDKLFEAWCKKECITTNAAHLQRTKLPKRSKLSSAESFALVFVYQEICRMIKTI
jgi:hypothetical protein